MIEYKPALLKGHAKKREIDKVVGEVGSVSETNGLVKNEAATKISHLLGAKAEKMFGETLEDLRANPQQFSAVFKDKGLRLEAIKAIGEKARVTDFPITDIEVYDSFSQYMEYCQTFFIPPSLGMFAAWCGADVSRFEKYIREYKISRPDVAAALEVSKEIIRGFLESKAVDGEIAPAVYLHQNKVYFDAVETSMVRHEQVSDAHVRDQDQISEIVDMLPCVD